MQVHLMENRRPEGWTTFGGYWPRSLVRSDSFRLENENGEPVAVQSEIAARWPDGSVKWSRHTARADALGAGGELIPSGEKAAEGLALQEDEGSWTVYGRRIRITVPKEGGLLAQDCRKEGLEAFSAVRPVLLLCHADETGEESRTETLRLPAEIRQRTLETAGPLETVFRFDGVHLENGRAKMPFRIRMSVREDGEIVFDDTFFFQGDAARDRLAGWGLRFETHLSGRSYQRQIRLLTDGDVYRDNPTQLFYWRKHLDRALLAAQCRGETVAASEELDALAEDLPRWDRFCLIQDSAEHFVIRKKAWDQGCWLGGVQGRRAPGGMAVSDPGRTLSFQLRECWEKHPAGLEAADLSGETTQLTAWFHAPQTEPFDFRHYDRRTYPLGNYEGFDYMRADPNGISVTCRLSVYPENGYIPDSGLIRRSRMVRRPPVYLASPAYYRDHGAFGLWSLPGQSSEVEKWMEEQLQAACRFFLREQEERSWYGLFDFGDIMHTYEACRHMWRWDVGGYAWDNTELAPTYWLWLQFMRTGKEDVFRLAEALSRHTADVDMYHFGELKGLGSRHNVRHWGCPCKEPRISMAGHHRPLYYLTGDRRIGDCMEDSLQAAGSLAAAPWFVREDGKVHLRSGPDWAALVSGWMTAYERTLAPGWREKIETGIADLMRTPLGLTSGPEYGFDPETGHLIYTGEAEPGSSMHLQACMGETEVWLETADMLENRDLAEMTAHNGLFFFLSPEERSAASGGLLAERRFGSPVYSAEMQAWAAKCADDPQMARTVWVRLLSLLYSKDRPEGFRPVPYGTREDGTPLTEIPWITANFTAQWCLKVIVTKAMIPDSLPETLAELAAEIERLSPPYGLYGA